MGIVKNKSIERQSSTKNEKHKLDMSTDSSDASSKQPKESKEKELKIIKEKSPQRSDSPTSPKEPRKKSPNKEGSPRTSKTKKRKFETNKDNISVIYPSGNPGIRYPSAYFRDGVRRVDFILVTTKVIMGNPDTLKVINNYVENLKSRNLAYEFEYGKIITSLFFIKINVSDSHIPKLAAEYHINLTYSNPNYDHDKYVKIQCFRNDLNAPQKNNPLYNRSSSVGGDRPTDVTDAERSMIANKVLGETSYGSLRKETGHKALVKKGILVDVYPLHDPNYNWTEDGVLSDRQLLRKYWANFSQIIKSQPLNLIEKYFSSAHAFYFAWVGFYIKMLTFASILGFLFFISGGVYFTLTSYSETFIDVCNSDIVLCPECKNFTVCNFGKLKDHCDLMIASYFFDNDITIIFAIIMSLWSTLFMAYWNRYEARLRFRWNVRHLTVDTSLRYEYLDAATEQRTLANGETYVKVPKKKRLFHIIVTYSACISLLVLLIAVMLGFIIYRVGARYTMGKMSDATTRAPFIVSISSSIFIYCFIGVFGKLYETIALILTRYEYHRTVLEHDNSYIYKITALSFANNYAAITYLAFFKGKFYTHPGNDDNVHSVIGLGEDLCDPAGCLIDLTIQLASIMISRSLISMADQFIVPYLKHKFNELRYHRKKDISVPHWEEEFFLSRTSKYDMVTEWTSMLIQYGFVTFYVAALPIAPFIAWLNNIVELRIDAIKMITTKKRSVGQRTPGIGVYRGVIKAMTIAGIATNAFVLAFTTDFIPRFIYAVSHDKHHYRKAKLSKFALSDFKNYTASGITAGQTVCYYPGYRHPPGHKEKYTLTEDYWKDLAARFIFVIIFEHVLVTFTGILAYAIPKQSLSLEIESNKQEIAIRQAKNAILNVEREKQKKKRHFAFHPVHLHKPGEKPKKENKKKSKK